MQGDCIFHSSEMENEEDKSKEGFVESGEKLNPILNATVYEFDSAKSSTSLDYYVPTSGPLLGSEEMDKYLHERKVIIQITTWNMGSLPLPSENHLRKLFYHDEHESLKKVDIHVVAIQECWPDADAWELAVQGCLGPGFALFHSLAFGTLHISIFILRNLLWFTTETTDFTQSVRAGRLFKTKGAAGIGFGFFGSTFFFINAHLSAGEEESRVRQRIEELKKILNFNGKSIQHYDIIILCGDLNFRISGLKRESIFNALKTHHLEPILERDQLNRIFQRKDQLPKNLAIFHEAAAITFRPTYKYDIGNDTFDTSSKKRIPAYTDRILFRKKTAGGIDDNQGIICLAYEAVLNMKVSDHKPVYAIFSIDVKPGYDTLPLSGARFKRDVYVKAVQKRARYLLDRRKKLASSVCEIS